MTLKTFYDYIKATVTGVGQVMFQQNFWTGLVFLAGIFWGSYQCGLPEVAWGALVGVFVSTAAGFLLEPDNGDGNAGLFGFNGALVGCAFPTFLGNTWQMWIALAFCAALTPWVRTGFNRVMTPWKVNSLTFPFVFLTWIFLLASRMMHGMAPDALSVPTLTETFGWSLDTSLGSLVEYWLKGISQVFLVDSWVTGIFFIVALAICSRWAAMWAMVASAVSLGVAIVFHADPSDIASGLFGFSPVLTGIALGCTFYAPCVKSALWTLTAIVATVFVQAGMDSFFAPLGIPTLTGPFCITTWLFWLQQYTFKKAV